MVCKQFIAAGVNKFTYWFTQLKPGTTLNVDGQGKAFHLFVVSSSEIGAFLMNNHCINFKRHDARLD